jgi:hypothetical protein
VAVWRGSAPFYEAGSVKSQRGSIGLTFYPSFREGAPLVAVARGPRLIQLLQMTLPILTIELEAPREQRAFVISIESFAVFPNPNPQLMAGAGSSIYHASANAEDRATLGSDPSAAGRRVRQGRPPATGRRVSEAVGLWSRSFILPVPPKAINPF